MSGMTSLRRGVRASPASPIVPESACGSIRIEGRCERLEAVDVDKLVLLPAKKGKAFWHPINSDQSLNEVALVKQP